MSSFALIFEKILYNTSIISKKDISFKEGQNHFQKVILENKSDLYCFYTNCIRNIISSSLHSYEEKFNYIRKLLNNIFIPENDKIRFLDKFSHTQKIYHGFNKLAFLYKFKKKEYALKNDMYMNPIDENTKNTLSILHENKKYIFTFNDINKIIYKALSNSDNFYNEPLPVKNPFNNLPFLKSHLYYFYFSIKTSLYNVNKEFQYFFYCNFSMNIFINKYESVLRDNKLKSINLKDKYDWYDSILDMIQEYNNGHKSEKIIIHPDLPKSDIVKIFGPFLKYYYLSIYSLCSHVKRDNHLYVNAMLNKFKKENPDFGEKVEFKYFKTGTQEYCFDMKTKKESLIPVNYNKEYKNCHIKNFNLVSDFVNEYEKKIDYYYNNFDNPFDNYSTINSILSNHVISQISSSSGVNNNYERANVNHYHSNLNIQTSGIMNTDSTSGDY
tara:strand:+ start:15953 stop:17275 length:1323 start_codon:yes stop_codon:yes gene_type:complete